MAPGQERIEKILSSGASGAEAILLAHTVAGNFRSRRGGVNQNFRGASEPAIAYLEQSGQVGHMHGRRSPPITQDVYIGRYFRAF